MTPVETDHVLVEKRLLDEALAPETIALDAGCGRTTRLRFYRDRISRLVGVDSDEEAGRANPYLDEFLPVDHQPRNQQRQHRERHTEPLGLPVVQAEGAAQRGGLRRRYLRGVAEHGMQELVQRRVREFRLRLDAGSPQEVQLVEVVEEISIGAIACGT